MSTGHSDPRSKTGISGLDEVVDGGLPTDAFYLVQGDPGAGKTTLALQFLMAGREAGERVLYVTFSETAAELAAVTRSHGWSLEGIDVYDLSASRERLERDASQTIFHPAEIELEEAITPILAEVARLRPQRLVIDSLSEIRLLAREPLRYRRQLLALKQFFVDRGCTVLLIDDKTTEGGDAVLKTLAHGVIGLHRSTPEYGATRRRFEIEKLRGVMFREGFHDYRIRRGGIVVYPRLVAREPGGVSPERVASGIPGMDTLLGGGLDRGSSTLLIGPAGTGKSSLAAQYVLAAATRGEKARVYTFEEVVQTWRARAASLKLDVEPHLAAGTIAVRQIDPAELSPGELAADVIAGVEQDDVRLVVIDSLNGYLQSAPGEGFLTLHLHELLTDLAHRSVTTILTLTQGGMLGPVMTTPLDVSYLVDTVVLLRYFESQGRVRQAISVMKKRGGKHERTIREYVMDDLGLHVGEPLTEFDGVLTGVPSFRGGRAALMDAPDGTPGRGK